MPIKETFCYFSSVEVQFCVNSGVLLSQSADLIFK